MFSKDKKAKEIFTEALSLLENEDRKAGIDTLYKVVKAAPKNAEAWSYLALNLALEGRYQDMDKAYEKIIDLKPEDATIWNRVGEALLECPMAHEDACYIYQVSLSIEKTAEGWKGLGDSLLKMGKLKEVAEAYARWCVLEPENSRAWFRRGQALNMIKDREQAALALRNAIRLDPEYAPAHSELAVVLGKQGKYKEALDICESWARLRPKSYRVWYYRASLLAQIDRPLSALESYSKAEELEDNPWQVWFDKARIYSTMGDYTTAAEQLKLTVENLKRPWDAWQSLGNTLIKLGEFEKALEAHGKALRILTNGGDPVDFLFDGSVCEALCHQARAFTNNGDSEKAQQIWKLLQTSDKCKDLKAAGQAYTTFRLGDKEEAFASLEKQETGENAWAILSGMLEETGFIEEAIEALDKQIEIETRVNPLLIEKAHLLCKLKEHEKAASLMESILENKKRHSKAYFELASIQAESGNDSDCLKNLSKALEIKPALLEWAQVNENIKPYLDRPEFKELIETTRTSL